MLSSVTDLFRSRTFEKRDVSSAKILLIDIILSGKSYESEIKEVLIQIPVECQS